MPRELDEAEGIRLAREFVEREFVVRGMVADLNVHWDIGADGQPKPHAHVMLTMREVNEQGFGAKVRDWNRTDLLNHWREAWADQDRKSTRRTPVTNAHLVCRLLLEKKNTINAKLVNYKHTIRNK